MAVALILFRPRWRPCRFLAANFMPDFREGHFVIGLTMAPGTSLPEMRRLGARISAELLKIPAIQTVSEQIGRARGRRGYLGAASRRNARGIESHRRRNQEKVQDDIRDTLAKFPGVQTEVLTFLGDRIGETISGETAQVVVNVFGDDLDVLDAKAKEVAAALNRVPGAADVQMCAPPGAPRMVIRLRPDRLTQFGFRPLEVLEAVRTAYQGDVVAQTYEGEKVFDVAVILEPARAAGTGGHRRPVGQQCAGRCACSWINWPRFFLPPAVTPSCMTARGGGRPSPAIRPDATWPRSWPRRKSRWRSR